MAKSSGRIALYELVNKARFKSAQQKALESTGEKVEKASEPAIERAVETVSRASEAWSKRPKSIRLYPDRIEVCFSWQVAIIGILAFLAILLVFFKFGRMYSSHKAEAGKTATANVQLQNIMPETKPVKPAEPTSNRPSVKMVEPMGDNMIVIASYELASHLEPVKQYFANFGIATKIIKKGSRHLLVTQDRFDNPEKAGTDGYEMKKKIISIGANYKPPAGSGFESFGSKPFNDAYGMKFE